MEKENQEKSSKIKLLEKYKEDCERMLIAFLYLEKAIEDTKIAMLAFAKAASNMKVKISNWSDKK